MSYLPVSLRSIGKSSVTTKIFDIKNWSGRILWGYLRNSNRWVRIIVKNGCFVFVFCLNKINKNFVIKTGLKTDYCLSLRSLGLEHFSWIRRKTDERSYTKSKKSTRSFLRRTLKGGEVGAFNQNKHIEKLFFAFDFLSYWLL